MIEPQTAEELFEHYSRTFDRMNRNMRSHASSVNLTPEEITQREAERIRREEINAALAIAEENRQSERARAERVEKEREKARGGKLLRDVAAICATEFDVSLDDILGDRRYGHVVRARQAAMWLCRRMFPDTSLPAIGIRFNRDHTTVLHAIKKVQAVVDRLGIDHGTDVEAWAKALAAATGRTRCRRR